jgi:catalase-peroxidase
MEVGFESDTIFEGHNRTTGELKGWYSRRFDIRLEFRAVLLQKCMDADSSEKFVNDFVKVMSLDRFDLVKS